MTKPSAGNTGRHQDTGDSLLWDRLRADLANLGTDVPDEKLYEASGKVKCCGCGLWVNDVAKHVNELYCSGALLSMTPQSPLTAVDDTPVVVGTWAPDAVTSQRSGSRKATPDESNAFFDALLLASRKRRERQSWINFCDREDNRTWNARQAEHERAQMLEMAMSTPLDRRPCVGWRGAPLDE